MNLHEGSCFTHHVDELGDRQSEVNQHRVCSVPHRAGELIVMCEQILEQSLFSVGTRRNLGGNLSGEDEEEEEEESGHIKQAGEQSQRCLCSFKQCIYLRLLKIADAHAFWFPISHTSVRPHDPTDSACASRRREIYLRAAVIYNGFSWRGHIRVKNIHCCRDLKRRVTSIIQVAYGYMRLYLSDETHRRDRGGAGGGGGEDWRGKQKRDEIWIWGHPLRLSPTCWWSALSRHPIHPSTTSPPPRCSPARCLSATAALIEQLHHTRTHTLFAISSHSTESDLMRSGNN